VAFSLVQEAVAKRTAPLPGYFYLAGLRLRAGGFLLPATSRWDAFCRLAPL